MSNGRRTCTDGPVQSVPRKSNLPPDKKRKSVRNEESTRHESVPDKVESAGKHSSWLQKSSWKALVGDKGSRMFSVSSILPDGSATEEGDNAFKSSIEDMQLDDNEVDEDEDDLVINVLPKKNSRVSLPKNKESEIISTVYKVWLQPNHSPCNLRSVWEYLSLKVLLEVVKYLTSTSTCIS